jgi:catechol 2,3-dioxygenase-like lactoylglutathione lyase family enzyme
MDRAWEMPQATAGRKLKPPGDDGKAQISDHGLKGNGSETIPDIRPCPSLDKAAITGVILPSTTQPWEASMFKRLDHIALHVTDVERSAAFYESLFGFERYFTHAGSSGAPITYLRLGGTVIELTQRPAAEPMSGFHFCLETDDIASASMRLVAAGVEQVQKAYPTAPRSSAETGWHRAVFRGPAGELIELRGPVTA